MGVEVTSNNGADVRLTLDAAVTGGSSVDLRNVAPRVEANRVVYDTGDVQQSFVNGPLGVEQRFLIRHAPARAGARLDLAVKISGAAHPTLSADRRSALLGTRNGPVFRYSGLAASDWRGHTLAARIRPRGGQLVLEVQTRGARFPITVDPLLSPYAMLTGPSEVTSRFGSSIALSNDGNTLAVGGEGDDSGLGAVWVFARSGGAWMQQGPKLTPQGPSPPPLRRVQNFGWAVAISADGNRIIVGDGRSSGLAAWVFARKGGAWHQQGPPVMPKAPRLEASGSEGVGLSGDGRTAVLSGVISSTPHTWVYVWSRGRWRQQGRPLPVGSAKLALSANGSTLLVAESSFVRSRSHWRAAGRISPGRGAEGFSNTALSADGMTALVADSRHGYALVYKRSRSRWIRVARLTSPHPEAQFSFAEGVALSADGTTALIGASPRSETSAAKPLAYVFTRTTGNNWTPTAAVTMSRPWLAVLSADASTIVAAPPLREVGERIVEQGGPARVLTRAGNGWQEQAALAPSDATGADSRSFGGDFALSSDASTALVSEGASVGWVFSHTGASWTRQARLQLEGAAGGGAEVALSADGNTAVLAGPSAPGPVAAWVFSRTSGAWSAGGTPLIASGIGPRPPGSREELESFASSVAVSARGDVILVGADWDSGRTGAAWVFTRSGSSWAQQGPKLTPSSPSPEERFGNSVALSANGEVALVGGVGDRQHPPEGSPAEGAAYLFTRSGNTWTQTAKLIDGEQNRYESRLGLGSGVALSADGNTALLGAHDRALVFVRAPSGWQQHHPPLRVSGYGSYALYGGRPAFGEVIAISADGGTALIGGIPEDGCGKYHNEACSFVSGVWAFRRAAEAWVRQPLPLVTNRSFGGHVALSGNGETALIRGVTPGPEPGGAVFVSQVTPPPQSGFVIEPTQVEYEGSLELKLWTPKRAAFRATARVTGPGAGVRSGGRACTPSRRVKKAPATRRCPSGFPIYGTGTAKGVENVGLGIAPRPAIRRYLAKHRRLTLAITIDEQPSAPSPPSTQTTTLAVTYRKPPPPQY